MTERELGDLSARVTAMEKNLQALTRDTREIRDALLTLRGGKRMLIVVIGAAASIGAGLATWIPALFAR
jgi:type IV secretory pathway TrbD component